MADKLHEELQPGDGIHPVPAWKVAALTDITSLTSFDVGRVAAVEREGEPGRWDFFILAELVIDEMGDQPTWTPLGITQEDFAQLGALANASLVVLGADGTLANERVLDVEPGLSITDNGPGAAVRIARAPTVHVISTGGTHVLDNTKVRPDGFVYCAALSVPTLQLPADSAYNWPIGTRFEIAAINANTPTVGAGPGATATFHNKDEGAASPFAGPVSLYIGNTALCVKTAANTWLVFGAWNRNYTFARSIQSFIVASAESQLSNERVLTAGAGLASTDGGSNSTFTLALNVPHVAVASTAYTLALTDAGKLINFSSVGTTVTIPPNSVVPFPIGTMLWVKQGAPAGNNLPNVTIALGAGVTSTLPTGRSSQTRTNQSTVCLHKIATDTWNISGDLSDPTPYITLSAVGDLTAERYLGTAFGHSFADGGPGNPVYAAHTLLTATQTGNYTFSASDRGGIIQYNNASTPGTFTIPAGLLAAGSEIFVTQIAAQPVTIAAGGGVTLTIPPGTQPKTRGLNAVIHLRNYRGQDTWTVSGELEEVRPINSTAGSFTLNAAHNNTMLRFTNSTPVVLTVDTNAVASIPIGAEVYVVNAGTSTVTVTPTAGVTFVGGATASLILNPGEDCWLRKVLTDTWVVELGGSALQRPAYVCVGNDAKLLNERALQIGPGLAMTDTGGGNNITLQGRDGLFTWTSGPFGLNSTHENGFIYYTGSANVTLTIPTNAADPLPLGYTVRFANVTNANAVVTLSFPGVSILFCGVTPVNNTLNKNEAVRFTKTSANGWIITWESPNVVPVLSYNLGFGLTTSHNEWLFVMEGHTADITISVPTDAAQYLPIGFRCEIFNSGGTSSWSVMLITTGLTLLLVDGASPSQISAYDKATLTKIGANRWMIENTTVSP